VCKNPLKNFSLWFTCFVWAGWDQDVTLLIDYISKGQTINADYYSSLLVQLKDILKEEFREKFNNVVSFLHDSATGHRVIAIQCLVHPHYSPDLAPSEYYLFHGLKKTIEISPFFVQSGGHCGCGDLTGQIIF
jgi:histone-lysine N-methyltransferase SETMAR